MRDLIVEASGYKDGLGNKLDDIDKYQSPINQEKNVVVEKKYDCLNDKEVFEMMSGYLLACGKEYVSKIFENPEREVVVREFFRKCDGDTPIGLMEQVDVFLHRFENEWKDEYF